MGRPRKKKDDNLDLTRGLYRLQFGNYIKGKRINGLSLPAEAWFWRVHAACDDYGNTERDPHLCWAATLGRRRDVTADQVEQWLSEMESVKLISTYDVAGERYLHVLGFIVRQPGGRNGRRIRRYPQSPWDDAEIQARDTQQGDGESGGIPVNPSANDNDDDNDNEYENDDDNEIRGNPPAPPPSRSVVVAMLGPEGLGDDPILDHPNATEDRVRIAIENANAKGASLKDRKGFICAAIRGKYNLSKRAKQRRDAAALAAAQQRAQDRQRQAETFVRELGEEERARLFEAWVVTQPEPQRDMLRRCDPLSLGIARQGIYELAGSSRRAS